MEPKPVERKTTPDYPTRRQLLKGGAAIVLFGPLAAAAGPPQVIRPPVIMGMVGPPVPHEPPIVPQPAPVNPTVVAPLFEHGDGRGSTGCVVVSPPVFLSEEEAMQVIQEELAEAGVRLRTKRARDLPGVEIDLTNPQSPNAPFGGNQPASKPVPSDAEARKQPIAVQFVSKADVTNFRPRSGMMSSVTSYNSKETAERLSKAIAEQCQEELHVGMFYDPIILIDWRGSEEYAESSEKAKEESLEEVRLQAKDFVAWLKEQEAI
jgi:hypothetical protein